VHARAREIRPSDTGVEELSYRVSGEAVVSPTPIVIPLPVPQKTPTLDFVFDVKADLSGIARSISIDVGAKDVADNECEKSITINAVPAPEVRVTLTWSGVEDLDLLVAVCELFCFEGTPGLDVNDRCEGAASPTEIVELSGGDAPLTAEYTVSVGYEKSCQSGGGPFRSVPFTVRIEHDGMDSSIDGEIEAFTISQIVSEFTRPGRARPLGP
jgi:hypothetical protein